MLQLPKPHYQPIDADPAWLVAAVQFHGHLGPWLAAGLRAGMAAREAVGAEGFFDVEVTVFGPLTVPPQSCFLDGVQASTGATLGKRNIYWTETGDLALRVRNTRSGATAELRPTSKLAETLGLLAPKSDVNATTEETPQEKHARVEGIARSIATAGVEELFDVVR